MITSLRAQAAFLKQRKAELGYVGTNYVAVNPGGSRTFSKQMLLRRLAELARIRKRKSKFLA